MPLFYWITSPPARSKILLIVCLLEHLFRDFLHNQLKFSGKIADIPFLGVAHSMKNGLNFQFMIAQKFLQVSEKILDVAFLGVAHAMGGAVRTKFLVLIGNSQWLLNG